MTHLEWGLLMVAAALVLGWLLGNPTWYAAGRRRGQREGAWEAELDRAVGHPAGNGRHAGPDLDTLELPARPVPPYLASPVVFGGYATDPVPVPAGERELLASPVLTPSAVISPEELSWTGEIAAMTAKFEQDMARLIGGTDEQLKEITR